MTLVFFGGQYLAQECQTKHIDSRERLLDFLFSSFACTGIFSMEITLPPNPTS